MSSKRHYMKSCIVLLRSPDLPVKAAAQSPVSVHEEVDGCKQQHHGHRVVKETQHKDGVDPIRGTAHKEEHIWRNLGKIIRGTNIQNYGNKGKLQQQVKSLVKAIVTQTDLLGAVVYPEDKQQGDEVENGEKVLAQTDVHPMAGDVVESCEDVDKAGRVPATTRCSFNLH